MSPGNDSATPEGANSLLAVRKTLAQRFRAAGVSDPDREAALLIAAAAGLRAADWITDPDRPLGDAAPQVEAYAVRRERGEPLSRIVGRREFWSLAFRVTPDVLDPRADSETIVEAALSEFSSRRAEPLRILDLGIGSGAILAALLREFPNATGVGVDRSEAAAQIAQGNLCTLGLAGRAKIRVGDWGEQLDGPFDLIVSNPPYIPTPDIAGLDREVREHDPRLALDGGADGLDAHRALAPVIARLLEPFAGRFALEHGFGQGGEVRAILQAAGLRVLGARRDLGGIERVVLGGGARAI
jgi:release factor glutamine methyltransferase